MSEHTPDIYARTEADIIEALYEYRSYAIDPEMGPMMRQDAWQHIDQLLDILRDLRLFELGEIDEQES